MNLKFKRNNELIEWSYLFDVKNINVHKSGNFHIDEINRDRSIYHRYIFIDNVKSYKDIKNAVFHEVLQNIIHAKRIYGSFKNGDEFVCYFDQCVYVMNDKGETIDTHFYTG